MLKRWILIPVLVLLVAVCIGLFFCTNTPWETDLPGESVFFTSFPTQIRSLDASVSYYAHESYILDNIVESPLAYHYLKRPYELIPQLVTAIPEPAYFDETGKRLDNNPPAEAVATVRYTMTLKDDVYFQPHPCFDGKKRRLTSEDLRVAIVRLCDPQVSSPVYTNISSFLCGMEECSAAIRQAEAELDAKRLEAGESRASIQACPSLPDYRKISIAGVETPDERTVVFVLSRKYPQFLYWMSMHFFAPVAWEALEYYNRREFVDAGQVYGLNPVGTGAYMLETCEPNDRVVLVKNPNYHEMLYPSEGEPGDEALGLLEDAGKRLPLTDRIVFKYEKESIPTWIKFLQGYYDINGDNGSIPSDMMDVAVSMNPDTGEIELSPEMQTLSLRMFSNVMMYSYYIPINCLDPVLGGLSPEKCALRRALSMVIDANEYVNIFRNGNGVTSEGMLPPGIFGYLPPPERLNEQVHEWNPKTKRTECRSIDEARRLMVEAGYPNGLDADGNPLVLHLDHANAGNPNFKSRFLWLSDRLSLLGIRLEERQNDLNRLREQLEKGNWQMQFERAWVADYPDPENFLMLFYGPNGIVKSGGKGCNNFNYDSPEYDEVFKRLETMSNSPERQDLIDKANEILHRDAPVIWTLFPVNTILGHRWLYNYKANSIAQDKMKYLRVEPDERIRYQAARNRPVLLPFLLPLLLIGGCIVRSVFKQ